MTHLRLAASDFLVIIGYFVLVLWIGIWFRNRLVTMKDYFAAGNKIPWWMAGISHYMSSFSAFSFIAYAQIGYMYGWVAITLFWVTVPGCLAGGLIFAKRWRRARVITPVQFLEERFNGFVQQLFAWSGIPIKIFDDALKIFATGLFVSIATGLSLLWSIIICGVVMMAYLAQKYYSVRDEHEASKAAYFSAALNVLGAPLMILPAVIGRHILPGLVAQHRTADTCVLLVMRLLPAGMVGIIMAAMFSATMAAVSGDFNAIASVLTQDVYRRLIRPAASEHRLVFVGRWVTFGLGALTTVLSLWFALKHQQSLFNLMVTALGLFMAPTLLPLLAGLTVKKLNWQGAFAGFLCGLAIGSIMLAVKTWLPAAGIVFGSSYNFEGASLLANIAATILGMALAARIFLRKAAESERVEEFFLALDKPVQANEIARKTGNPAGPVLAMSTFGVVLLIAVAGLISRSTAARIIDPLVGLVLIWIGVLFHLSSRKVSASDALLLSTKK